MEKGEKFQRKKIGEPGYLNENCWLVRNLNYAPYKRCRYCESKFRNCLFLHYQVISLIFLLFFLTLSFLINGRISELVIISVFTLVIVYGYFFNKSTDKIIKANFAQRKANEALKELTEGLKEKVDEQVSEIKKLLEAREELLRIKEEFLHIVSHQLRTPVSIFWGLLDNWQTGDIEKLKEEQKKEIISQIIIAAGRLKNTVNDMLDALELGKYLELKFQLVDISSLIDETANFLKPNYDAKKLYLKIEKNKVLPQVEVSERFLKQALINLVDNAEKYTQKGGTTIKLSHQSDEQTITIEIKDTGIGLTQEDREKIFKTQFFRGQRAQDILPNGSGLGLYIAKQIIEKHRGKISVESAGPNQGTSFTVVLSVKQS